MCRVPLCLQVLGAYIAWTTSSSGCEQMFSQLKRSPAELASSRAETDRRLAVVIGSDPLFDQAVLEKARALYGQLLPSGRSRTATRNIRMDAGRRGQEKAGSKQAWIRKRKEAVDQAAALELVTPPRNPPVALPQSLEKEVNRQTALQKKEKLRLSWKGLCSLRKSTKKCEETLRTKRKWTRPMTKVEPRSFNKSPRK